MHIGIGIGIHANRSLVGEAYLRSLNPAAWFRPCRAPGTVTVTGSGVSQIDDWSGNSRHLKQGTDANRPVSLLHSGTNYLYLPGVSGNYASTPDSVANSITGDIDIRVRVAMDDWTPAATTMLVAKDDGGAQRCFHLNIQTAGQLSFTYSNDGTSIAGRVATSSVATGVSDGAVKWVRSTYASASGKVNFFLSDDGTTWSALGTERTITSGSIFDSATSPLEIGSFGYGAALNAKGKIYRAIIKNGIDGTTVVDFDPSRATDQAGSFVASTGETWTINSTGSKPAQIVGSSRILADGSAHKMATDAFTANQPRTRLSVVYANSWTSGDFLDSGTAAEAGLTQTGSTPSVSLNAGAAAAANTGLTLGAWHVVCEVINGASSSITVDNGAETTGNAGANNPGGIALFSNQAGSGYFNGMIREYIDLPIALDATQRARAVRAIADGIVAL